MSDQNAPNGVIDFNKAKSQLSASRLAKKKAGKGSNGPNSKPPRQGFMLYIQYFVFLGIVAYLVKLCRG